MGDVFKRRMSKILGSAMQVPARQVEDNLTVFKVTRSSLLDASVFVKLEPCEVPVCKGGIVQVRTNPHQTNGYDCGVYAGLAAEVFCTYATGTFFIRRGGVRLSVHCEGQHPDFLMRKDSWFTSEDVSIARHLTRAAGVALWRSQCPTKCPGMEQVWAQAIHKATTALPKLKVPESRLWYVALQCMVLVVYVPCSVACGQRSQCTSSMTMALCREAFRQSTVDSRRLLKIPGQTIPTRGSARLAANVGRTLTEQKNQAQLVGSTTRLAPVQAGTSRTYAAEKKTNAPARKVTRSAGHKAVGVAKAKPSGKQGGRMK